MKQKESLNVLTKNVIFKYEGDYVQINLSYTKEFDKLMSDMRKKYPEELFELEGIGSQLDISKFSKKFFNSKVNSDSSIDANANVDDTSVIAYDIEMAKPYQKLNSYYVLWKKLKKIFDLDTANKIIEHQISGDIYINDMHGIGSSKVYCFNFSTYDILTKGLPMVKKIKSYPPKYLYSFKSQLEQFIIIASNSTLGATGIADVLVSMSHYIENILNNGHDAGFYFDGWFSDEEKKLIEDELLKLNEFDKNIEIEEIERITKSINEKLNKKEPYNKKWFESNVYKYAKENIVSFIYTINQPLRGQQSAFTNISVYDNYFLDKICNDYIYPDGTMPNKEIIKKLQKIYLDTMNKEMERTPITFPVTTACFSIDEENNIKDEEFLYFIAKENKKYGFINIYSGDSSTLSSCCFDGEQKFITTNGIFRFKDFKEGDIVEVKSIDGTINKATVHTYGIQKLYNITFDNEGKNIHIKATKNHTWYLSNGNITNNLKIGDELIVLNNNRFIVKDIEDINEFKIVWCLDVENTHNFFLENEIPTGNCRLRSEQKSEYFNSFGSGSSKIGSLGVCTINLPRIAIKSKNEEEFINNLKYFVGVCAKVNQAKREIVKSKIKNGNQPLYTYEFMDITKQYSTAGVSGFNEAIMFLGKNILNEDGVSLGLRIINTINEENKKYEKEYNAPHNCEQIPAETVSVKIAKKDNILGYQDGIDLYSNQFIPLTTEADLLDRIKLQGIFDKHFTGGAILHLNCENKIDDEKLIANLIKVTAKMGVVYHAINYVLNECEDGHMTTGLNNSCDICGKKIINKYTRVVGFLTNVKNWNKVRREKDFPNRKFYKGVKL